MRITQKLGVLVAVPLCAVSGFGAIALVNSTSGAVAADHLWSLMNTANAAGDLICELQDERTAAAVYLTSAASRSAYDDLMKQVALTDQAVQTYLDLASRLPFSTDVTTRQLEQIKSDLNQLRTLRAQYKAGTAPALSAVAFQYRIAIADLAAFRTGVAQAGGATPAVATKIQAANQLYLASEYTGQEEATVLRVAINQPLTQSAQQEIAAARRGYGDSLEAFSSLADARWRPVPDQALTGLDIALADQNENSIALAPLNSQVHVNPDSWTRSMSARRDALDKVQHQIDLETLGDIAKIRDRQETLAGLEAASIAGTLLIAVVVSLRLGRPMIRGLRELRDSAHAVAYEHLPAAVETLRGTGSLTGRTPEEFADEAGVAMKADRNDELGAVARAFNAVHHEAIRTAAEQVLLRAGVGATFVALARRGERLTSALTMELDRAERDEQDPDRLARLFVLDHLAARMSRNNESLLVLGGEGTARVRDSGVPLNDVIRAALGRIERYTRVDLTVVDEDIVVVPAAVDHLVHLIAELLDNATTFSAPDSRVTVDARQMADRVIVQIADRGIGMTPAQRGELNARLASPRQVDVSTVRAMGLTVVAHLASWYGIDIELRPRPEGGTIAELMLPTSLYAAPGRAMVTPGQAEAMEAAAWAVPSRAGALGAETAAGAWAGTTAAGDGSESAWPAGVRNIAGPWGAAASGGEPARDEEAADPDGEPSASGTGRHAGGPKRDRDDQAPHRSGTHAWGGPADEDGYDSIDAADDWSDEVSTSGPSWADEAWAEATASAGRATPGTTGPWSGAAGAAGQDADSAAGAGAHTHAPGKVNGRPPGAPVPGEAPADGAAASWADTAWAESAAWATERKTDSAPASWADASASGASWPGAADGAWNPVEAAAIADHSASGDHSAQLPATSLPAWPTDADQDWPARNRPAAQPAGEVGREWAADEWADHSGPAHATSASALTPVPPGGFPPAAPDDDQVSPWLRPATQRAAIPPSPAVLAVGPGPGAPAGDHAWPVSPGPMPTEPQPVPTGTPLSQFDTTPQPTAAGRPAFPAPEPAWATPPGFPSPPPHAAPEPSFATRAPGGEPGWSEPARREPASAATPPAFVMPQPPVTAPPRPAAPPAADPAKTTLHGLPIRVPMARIPAEAVAAGAPAEPPSVPAERDPEKVASTMAAYARGLTGRQTPGAPPSYPYP